MASINLSSVLEGLPGTRKEGAAHLFDEEVDATVFISLGQEVLQVARIARAELQPDFLVKLTTHRGERFFFQSEQIVGLRLGGEPKALRSTAGFR